jgi:hypothetical protein
MRRRRRPQREIPFSFDSFLDVVANVVGIILRLILVAWVGARAYHVAPTVPPPAAAQAERPDEAGPPTSPDPLHDELERQRRELADARQRLLDQLRRWDEAGEKRAAAEKSLEGAEARVRSLRAERETAERAAAETGRGMRTAALSLPEIQGRVQQVNAEIDALKNLPPPKHVLRYQTPVSTPLQTEEVFFECRAGRVAVIDVGAMLEQMHRDREAKAQQLARQWEVESVTDPVGPFRMRYTLEREHSPADGPAGAPLPDAQFRYDVSWLIEPLRDVRGEPEEDALAPKSEFRRVVDALDSKVTAVTFWVYSDSFPLYRRLRDYLHERDFVVAGRPLLDGMPIGSSRRGTASRGQ